MTTPSTPTGEALIARLEAGEGVLKPCPFCGGQAQVSRRVGYAFVLCGKCHAEGPVAREDANHAANAWNRRATGAAQ